MAIEIYNEDCFKTMEDVPIGQFDIILTSPFYNTNKKASRDKTISDVAQNSGHFSHIRYDVHVDNMSNSEYSDYSVKLFNEFDRVLNVNGCVLYNLSYGSNNTTGMIEAVNSIIQNTEFTLADIIVWKKRTAIPNNCSRNKLTRICEFVFVFCRKSEFQTFECNKPKVSVRNNGQTMYGNIFNYIEAKNNDEKCPINKSTYSVELCEKLLKIYAVKDDTWVYDPFCGSGTTGVACKKMGFNFIGSEISQAQCEWARKRIEVYQNGMSED